MFNITQYLQYKNTLDGKPRVLTLPNKYEIEKGRLYFFDIEFCEHIEANLSDCRPLLSVEIDGIEWTEGDIIFKQNQYGIFYYNEEGANFMFEFKGYSMSVFDLNKEYFDDFEKYNFFDDPAKYSKLLWNCNETEGWEKVFELLEIKLK